MKKKKKTSLKQSYDDMMAQYGSLLDPWGNQKPNYPQQEYAQMPQSAFEQYGTPSYTPTQDMSQMQLDPNQSSPSEGQNNGWHKFGAAASQVGSMAGQISKGLLNTAPAFLNALIPDQKPRKNTYIAPTYNPFPMGTGSQSIYEDGGMIRDVSSKKNSRFKATEEVPFNLPEYTPSYVNPLPTQNPYQQAPQKAQVPPMNPYMDYQGGYDSTGNLLQYYPVPYNMSRRETINSFQNLPENYNGYPVVNSPDLFSEATQNFALEDDFTQWKPFRENYEDGGIVAKSGIHINPKNKGKFNATKKKTGKTTEELTHSKNPLTRKRAVFAQNAKKWNHSKKEFGGTLPNYVEGNEYEMDDSEIQRLISLGYKISQ